MTILAELVISRIVYKMAFHLQAPTKYLWTWITDANWKSLLERDYSYKQVIGFMYQVERTTVQVRTGMNQIALISLNS